MKSRAWEPRWAAGSVLFVVALWYIASSVSPVVEAVVGSPAKVAALAHAAVVNDGVLRDVVLTLEMFTVGLLLAAVVGCAVGLLIGRTRFGVMVTEIPLSVANTLPLVALIPPLIILMGISSTLRIFVTFLAAAIPIVWNVSVAARHFPRDLERTSRVFGITGASFLLKMLLPYITPYLATGIRVGAGRGLVTLLVTEMYVQGYGGLGAWLAAARVTVDPNLAMFVTLLTGLLGVALMSLFSVVERLVAPWRAA